MRNTPFTDADTVKIPPKQQHTPEPWKFLPGTKNGTILPSIQCGNRTTFAVSSYMCEGSEVDANGTLMAAAPAMLSALQHVLHYFTADVTNSDLDLELSVIRKAISKATNA